MLRRYVALVEPVLRDPERWLGIDDGDDRSSNDPVGEGTSEASSSRARQAARVLGRGVLGTTPPASSDWSALRPEQRSAWWVTRIVALGGVAAAAPRAAGVLADRLPLRDALGAAASGLAVCAVAREYGRADKAQWVPLLARVLFARDLPAEAGVEPAGQPVPPEPEPAEVPEPDTDGAARRPVRTLWRLARTFSAVSSLFDERPRGGLVARAVAKVPVVGVAGGWFDERGAIHKAAERTRELVAGPS